MIPGSYEEARRAFQIQYFGNLLRWHGYRLTEVAKAAGMNRSYLYKLLKNLGLLSAPGSSSNGSACS